MNFILLAGLSFSLAAQAQQITRIAVVDVARVFAAFPSGSQGTREFNDKSAQIQAEINRRNKEIQDLKTSLAAAEGRGNQTEITRLGNEINQKTRLAQEYFQSSTAELETMRAKLGRSDSFYNQIYGAVRVIAESEGYSMVLIKEEPTNILWYSPSVDITNKLIANLKANDR
jgi:outer membrane protein